MLTPPLAGKYKNNPYNYWFLWCFVITNIVLVTVWCVIYVQNINFVHTWFKIPGMPGASLTSLRNSFTSIVVRLAIPGHIFTAVMVMSMIMFRKNLVLSIGCLVVLGIFFVLDFFTLVVLGDAYSHCNGQEQYGNICNSKDYCCVHEILINPANMCPDTIDCSTPLTFDDVDPNPTFLGFFWVHFVMTMLLLAYFVAIAIIWKQPAKEEDEDEEEEEVQQQDEESQAPEKEEEDKTPSPPAAETTITRKLAEGMTTRRRRRNQLKPN